MPTSSQYQARIRDQAGSGRSVPGSPASSKSRKLENPGSQNHKTRGRPPPHHKSEPSLALFSVRKVDTPPLTPASGSGLSRSQSVSHLNKNGNREDDKFSNRPAGNRTPMNQQCTPLRSGVSHSSRRLLSSNTYKVPENHVKNPMDSFSCEINVTVSATPECYNKVNVETPHIKEGIGNISEIVDIESSNLIVGVRVRPLNKREKSDPSVTNVISVSGNEIAMKCDSGMTHTFTYDHCFLSDDPSHPQNADQEAVFSTMVCPLIEKMFEGYNACLFAYGQTGSGKSYSMMGIDSDADQSPIRTAGIIPRFCHNLFLRISENEKFAKIMSKVEISYFEIYNEKIHDLLGGSSEVSKKAPLRVREHPVFGPYVEDLSVHGVTSLQDLKGWLQVGRSQRATAATEMNEKSSRSHSIFSVVLTQQQEETVLNERHVHNRRSKINLVDLAGSERLANTRASGGRLREGVSINRSLLTLGKVISALSENSSGKRKGFIPYRDSVLTWLLRESLGGNSRTAMLATISPGAAHAEETLSSLRYACQARSIVNRARVNEDPADRLIRELRAEVERLTTLKQKKLTPCQEGADGRTTAEISRREQEIRKLKEQLQQTQESLSKTDRSWSERLQEAERKKSEELKLLRRRGVAITLDWKEPQPCLVNLAPDPILSGTLFYLLPPGELRVGHSSKGDGDGEHHRPDISLNGPLVHKKHCSITNEDGRLQLTPESEGQTFVNGQAVTEPTELRHGDRLIIGGSHYFKVHNPLDPLAEAPQDPVDYQSAHLEVQKVQEEKLQQELAGAKLQALRELEKARLEAERHLSFQRTQYERQLQRLGSSLERQKQALCEVTREKEGLRMEKELLEAQVQSCKMQLHTLDMDESFTITPYTTNFLEEIQEILNASPSTSEMKSEVPNISTSVNLHDMQMMIQEATQRCKELGIEYDFSHQHIVSRKSLNQAVQVKNRAKREIAFWDPTYFVHWLEQLRRIEPGESVKELMDDKDVPWEEYDSGEGDKEDGRITVNTSSIKRQLNESLLQVSSQSSNDTLEESGSQNGDVPDCDLQGITKHLQKIEDGMQNLWELCDLQNEEICQVFHELDCALQNFRSVLKIPDDSTDSVPESDSSYSSFLESIEVIESTHNTPAKSSLKSPAVCDFNTPKTHKSVRFNVFDPEDS